MHSQPLDHLAAEAAADLWTWLPEVYYLSPSDLADNILGLIFRVQAESLAAKSPNLLRWRHEIPLNPYARLICEVEQIADGPQRFRLLFSDPEDDHLPLREWEDASSGRALQRFAD